MLGTFIQGIIATEDPPIANLRRSKRRRTTQQEPDVAQAEEEFDADKGETDEDADYAEHEEEWISSSEDGGSNNGDEDEDGQEEEAEDSQDLVPLSTQLKRVQSAQNKAGSPKTQVKAADKSGNLNTLHSKLKLPDNPMNAGKHDDMTDEGCSAREGNHVKAKCAEKNMDEECTSRGKSPAISASVGKASSWDSPPPGFDIMKSIEEPTPPGEGTSGSHQNQVPSTATAMPNTFNTKTASSGIPAPHPPQ